MLSMYICLYTALGPLGHIHVNEIESEDELFPSSFKSDRKPLIEKVEENIKKGERECNL